MDSTLWAGVLQAGAGLVTGVLAVGGAVWVGLRQARISATQTEILSKQTELAAATLRSELFERRMKTYEVTAEFVARLTIRDVSVSVTEDQSDQLALKIRESQFLFRPEVYKAMVEIWDYGNRMQFAKTLYISSYTVATDMTRDALSELAIVKSWADQRILTLNEVFSPDLTIQVDSYP